MGVIYLLIILDSAEEVFFLELEDSPSDSITVKSRITDGFMYTLESSTPEVI